MFLRDDVVILRIMSEWRRALGEIQILLIELHDIVVALVVIKVETSHRRTVRRMISYRRMFVSVVDQQRRDDSEVGLPHCREAVSCPEKRERLRVSKNTRAVFEDQIGKFPFDAVRVFMRCQILYQVVERKNTARAMQLGVWREFVHFERKKVVLSGR